jgi:hypothetical protein
VAAGEIAEAEVHCQRAVEASRMAGPSMRKELVLYMRCLAAVEEAALRDGKALLDAAADIEEALYDEVSEELESRLARADASVDQGDLDAAEASCLGALSLARDALGRWHSAVEEPMSKLVGILESQGRTGDSQAVARELSGACFSKGGPRDPFSELFAMPLFDADADAAVARTVGPSVELTLLRTPPRRATLGCAIRDLRTTRRLK